MLSSRRSITVKVVAGYVIVAILAALAVWYIYNQVIAYSEIAQSNTENNQQLILVSEISTNLNESETLSRRLIQTGNEEELYLYDARIDSIKKKLNRLAAGYDNMNLESEADSIMKLLDRKTENLKELVALRDTDINTNYYSRVINELKKIDESFADDNYERRFANLEPHQKRVLIKLLEYAKEDNAQELTNQRLDSLVTSVKKVLTELEIANRRFRNEVNQKENELLNNDMILNQQLQRMLAGLEQKERVNAVERAEVFQGMLNRTSTIIIIGGSIIVFIIVYFIINIIGDITRSQRYRMELEEAKEFAESLLARREQFMAAITHDLRSPLTTVMGYTDLIQKTGLNEKQKHYLTQIRKSSDFILRLVNDLLDLSKLEAGKMLIEQISFNPKKLIEDTVYNVIPAEKKKEVEIIIDVSPETNAQIKSDPFRIKQILANLISNAWKFTQEGHIRIQAGLEQVQGEDHLLKITVEDTGIGISREMQENIFEEFSQENSSIEKRFGGSGLGLAITKRLTELLEGSISVESEQGKGSEFLISIPVIKISDAREEDEKEDNSEEIIMPNEIEDIGLKALIVDDEPGQLSLTLELVKGMGFETRTATNGKQALEILENESFDIILTDIQMPEVDGFGLVKKVREENDREDLPVIALSGRTDVSDEVYQKAGFNQNLLKPYKPDKLKQEIALLLDLTYDKEQEVNPGLNGKLQSENYDLSDIYEFSGRDEQAMNNILRAFQEGAKDNLKELKMAYESNNTDSLGKIAHRMLPMLRQMKAMEIAAILKKLEERHELAQEEFNLLCRKLEDLLEDLEAETTV